MPKCETCGADIIYMPMKDGEKRAFDAIPDPGRGNVVIDDNGKGVSLGGEDLTDACDEGVDLWVPHYRSCVNNLRKSHEQLL